MANLTEKNNLEKLLSGKFIVKKNLLSGLKIFRDLQ